LVVFGLWNTDTEFSDWQKTPQKAGAWKNELTVQLVQTQHIGGLWMRAVCIHKAFM